MILIGSLASVQKQVEQMKARGKSYIRWQFERFVNHVHARMSALDREHVRQELELVADFEAALRETYPDRSFVITHIPCYAVSFYQIVEGAPTEDIPPQEPRKETVWCQYCNHNRTYRLLPVPDPTFPKAVWGVCEVCGNDLVVCAGEMLTLLKARQYADSTLHPEANKCCSCSLNTSATTT